MDKEMPAFCPFCGGIEIVTAVVEWSAVSTDEPDNGPRSATRAGRSLWRA